MIVLDSDIVTLLSYGRNEKLRERVEAVEENEELAITLITRMEILQGRFASILKAANPTELHTATQRFRAAEEMLTAFVLLYPEEDSYRHFEGLLRQKKRLKMKRPDMLIASIALSHQALLVTRNVKDYKPVTDLRVENWAD